MRSASLLSFGRRFVIAVALLVALGLLIPSRGADLAPSENDSLVTQAVSILLSRLHVTRHPLDDEMSRRGLEMFLKYMDPQKAFFYQSDVDGFSASRDRLDDMLKKGDLAFAYDVHQVFLQRMNERLKVIDELLAAEHDFTADEEFTVETDAATYAKDEAEARENWRKRIKYDLLVQKTQDRVGEEATAKLKRRYHSFAARKHKTSSDDILEVFLTGMTTAFDPHTSYMSPTSFDEFVRSLSLKLDGIGALLRAEDGYTNVERIVPGGAAEKDGRLKPKDRVVGVGQGESGEIVNVVDMDLPDVVKLIRGDRDTVVRLQVIPDGATEPQVYTITRASIELKDAEAHGSVFEQGKRGDGTPYRVGMIVLPSFYRDMQAYSAGRPDFKSTTRDVKRILARFNKEGVDAVVLDLRINGGGSFEEAISLTGLFIDEGPVVQVKDEDGTRAHDDEFRGADWKGPLVVLTSKLSASASEIFAGAIQDYRRGLIVGDPATHGKGTVQQLMDLGEKLAPGEKLGALKLTIQQFYRPNGESTQMRGVLADIALPSITAHMKIGESDEKYAMEFDKVNPADYEETGEVTPAAIAEIRKLSEKRCQESEDFQKVLQAIARNDEWTKRKSITLNEAKFMALKAEMEDRRKEEQEIADKASPSSDEIKRDFYIDEALDITVDFIQRSTVAANR